ncbi:unnamed protein product [Owenia fusiformis]|uniref:Cytosolic endo-beta-N-acetylglucosaminidase n=1 Tax=Owenia fusiformis TaxID=6347 RepID=A0A8J1UA24_OWEFU|nr:unnamed protein product [Owenia fusiformis]
MSATDSGPQSCPLDTLDSVWRWSGNKYKHEISQVPIAPRYRNRHGNKLLLCHDLKNGYLEDRFSQGSSQDEAYRFYHWQYADSFVYFSHKLVTIPPSCWTNAAHRNGVKVLGTFITEWDEGAAICSELFESRSKYRKFADILVAIATFFNFEGWLINIENEIQEKHIEGMRHFVQYLTTAMHQQIPGSEVIWYDSVTNKGALEWQNELNDNNSLFFDACDGIFLNYTWKQENLVQSAENAILKQRKNDVYVGVDVFGRGCPGGGGYNTIEALQAARQHGLSVAMFAHAWTYEILGSENFTDNENKFWEMLNGMLFIHGSSQLPLVTSFCQGQGKKFRINGEVVKNSPWTNLSLQNYQPNFTNAQFLTSPPLATQPKMVYTTEDAWFGGGCLQLTGKTVSQGNQVQFKIFTPKITIDTAKCLEVTYTYKTACPQVNIGLELHFLVGNERKNYILGDLEKLDKSNKQVKSLKMGDESQKDTTLIESHPEAADESKDKDGSLEKPEKTRNNFTVKSKADTADVIDEPNEAVVAGEDVEEGEDGSIVGKKISRAAVEYKKYNDTDIQHGWTVRSFKLAFDENYSSLLNLVSLRCTRDVNDNLECLDPDFSILLGYIKIAESCDNSVSQSPCAVSGLRSTGAELQNTNGIVTFTTILKWKCQIVPFCFNIYMKVIRKETESQIKHLIGQATLNRFHVKLQLSDSGEPILEGTLPNKLDAERTVVSESDLDNKNSMDDVRDTCTHSDDKSTAQTADSLNWEYDIELSVEPVLQPGYILVPCAFAKITMRLIKSSDFYMVMPINI